MLKTIVFDLGGVFIDWNPRYLYRTVFKTEEAMNYFLNRICTFDWNEKQDAGRTLEEGSEMLVRCFPEYKKEILLFYGSWVEMLGQEDIAMVDFLRWLKKNTSVQILALTNWSAETFPIAKVKFPFLNDFDGILVSGEEKMAKPDPAIYKLLIERYKIDPSLAIFLDDNSRNVEASMLSGLPAYLHQEAQSSIDHIKQLLN